MLVSEYAAKKGLQTEEIINFMKIDERNLNYFEKYTEKTTEEFTPETHLASHAIIALDEGLRRGLYGNKNEETSATEDQVEKQEEIKEETEDETDSPENEDKQEIKETPDNASKEFMNKPEEKKTKKRKKRTVSGNTTDEAINTQTISESKSLLDPKRARGVLTSRKFKATELAMMSDEEVYDELEKDFCVIKLKNDAFLADKKLAKEIIKGIIIL